MAFFCQKMLSTRNPHGLFLGRVPATRSDLTFRAGRGGRKSGYGGEGWEKVCSCMYRIQLLPFGLKLENFSVVQLKSTANQESEKTLYFSNFFYQWLLKEL